MPELLDLFCGAGGAAMGYHRGGFDVVVGVDVKAQPHYPFEFVEGDALMLLRRLLRGGMVAGRKLTDFDAIHASPPCKVFTPLQAVHKNKAGHLDLVTPTRPLLRKTKKPWIMENVPGAPLQNYVVLCGGAFGLGAGDRHLQRHRLFELSFILPGLVPPCSHPGRQAVGVYGSGGEWAAKGGRTSYQAGKEESGIAMGIDWMSKAELAQAIPPAMTEFLAPWLLAEAALAAPAGGSPADKRRRRGAGGAGAGARTRRKAVS